MGMLSAHTFLSVGPLKPLCSTAVSNPVKVVVSISTLSRHYLAKAPHRPARNAPPLSAPPPHLPLAQTKDVKPTSRIDPVPCATTVLLVNEVVEQVFSTESVPEPAVLVIPTTTCRRGFAQ